MIPARPAPPELTVVVPVYNESANVARLVSRLAAALAGIEYEVVFVDDFSPDGTAEAVRAAALADPRCRLINRCGQRGLAGAAVEGMLSAQAPLVAVIDADLQHDETLLPRMKAALETGPADLAVATRYAAGGSGESLGGLRHALSALGVQLVRRLFGIRLSDPLSGFFMVRRELVEKVARRLSPDGFKILADLVISAPRTARIVELPYRFGVREHGESKLDGKVALEFAALLLSKLSGGMLPLRFILFCVVGGLGIVVHLATAWALLRLGQPFVTAQLGGTLVAMTSNFFLNNAITHRDRRLRGPALLRGLVFFYLICGFGVIANVGLAGVLFQQQTLWWLAALAGALVGTVWNYAISATLVWRQR
jgi:dolichol-phosphate mannosyltransferase